MSIYIQLSWKTIARFDPLIQTELARFDLVIQSNSMSRAIDSNKVSYCPLSNVHSVGYNCDRLICRERYRVRRRGWGGDED